MANFSIAGCGCLGLRWLSELSEQVRQIDRHLLSTVHHTPDLITPWRYLILSVHYAES